MVLLYRDPEGQNIFKKQKGSSVSNPQQMTIRPTEMALPSTLGQSVSGSHNYNLLSGSTAVNTSHVQSVNQATSSSSEWGLHEPWLITTKQQTMTFYALNLHYLLTTVIAAALVQALHFFPPLIVHHALLTSDPKLIIIINSIDAQGVV